MATLNTVPRRETFVCDANLDITRIGALCEQLKSLLASSKALTLDASAVARVDTAALQLLTAFVRGAKERGVSFVWQATSPAFATAAHRLGLAQELGLPSSGAGG